MGARLHRSLFSEPKLWMKIAFSTLNEEATSNSPSCYNLFLTLSGLANIRKTEYLEISDLFLFKKYCFPRNQAYYILLNNMVRNKKENRRMVIDATLAALFTMFFLIGVCWVIGKIHRFEQEVSWSRRRE